MTKIYFDMDGTIANLYKGEWLNDIINENTRPYEIADRLVEEADLLALANKGYRFGIVSWTAKNGSVEYNKAVRATKVEWLKANYPNIEFEEIHIVKYGTPKSRVVREKNSILFDDEEPNRIEWKGFAFEPNKIKGF